MKNYTIALFAVIMGLCACKKNVNDDLHGSLYIQGRLFSIDSLSKNTTIPSVPLGNYYVYLGYASDNGINYLYKVKTDGDGYFTFTTIDSTKTYLVFSRDTIGGVTYFNKSNPTKTNVSINNMVLKVYPSETDQNGMLFTTLDSASMQPVNACTICLFRSHLLFQADTCQGATFTLTTNANGNASQLNVAKGWYYANFKAIYQNGFIYSKDSVYVDSTGIARRKHLVKFK